ncbi:unnamed protein product [Allacma fusca]|uniref:G domain-containing protein n=1 Tax=Allacma fusca TaxID=39272 RepID=A0A8J2PWE9_9HEXA|nr:unnamed protein product [Allacma fusca]
MNLRLQPSTSFSSSNASGYTIVSCDQAVDGTVMVLEKCYKTLRSYKDLNDFVLIIGNTGTGKSTQKIFLTNPEDLVCYEAPDRNLIRDRDPQKRNISRDSTIISETLTPSVAVHKPTGTAFCDLPGFGDTRNECIQIVNAFTIKKVAEQAQKVKLLLVVNHSSLKSGESRTDILDLLKNITNFIQNPLKYAPSIALVATKVDSRKTSRQVIDGIGGFLCDVRSDLGKVILEDSKRAAAEQIIDALVHKRYGEYTRISIFSEPQELKSLNEIKTAMTERTHILSMLSNLAYANGSPDDFGLTLSPSAKIVLMKMAEKMNENISEIMTGIGVKVKKYLETRLGGSRREDLGTLFQEQQKLDTALKELTSGTKRRNFEFLQDLAKSLKLENVLGVELEKFELRQRKLIFIEDALHEDLPANILQWISPIQSSGEMFKNAILQKAGKYMEEMETRLRQICTNVYNDFRCNLLKLESNKKKSALLHKYIFATGILIEGLPEKKSVNTFIWKVQSILGDGLHVNVDVTTGLVILKIDILFGVYPFHRTPWIQPFEVLERKLLEANRIHAIKSDDQEEKESLEKKMEEQRDRMEARDRAYQAELKEQQERSQLAIQEHEDKLEEIKNKYEEEIQHQRVNWERRERKHEQQLKDQYKKMRGRIDRMEERHAEEISRNNRGFTIRIPFPFWQNTKAKYAHEKVSELNGAVAQLATAGASNVPNTFGARAKLKDINLDAWWLLEVNKRHNKDAHLYKCYQVNPYTTNTLDFTARKVNERKPAINAKSVKGYSCLRNAIMKPFIQPFNKKCHPETETQRFGWFPEYSGYCDPDRYDERFSFAHKTENFIKTDTAIRAHDKLMKELAAATAKQDDGKRV